MPCRRKFLLALVLAAVVGSVGLPSPARAAEPQKLFALDAERGTLTPVKGKPGVHRLVLERVRARALYFTDRPAREVGTVAVRPMLRALFAGDSPAPNAAVNATASKRGQLLMGVELRAWRYHPRDQRLSLRVRRLGQSGERTIKRVRNDVVLPRSFRKVSLFIDDCCGAPPPALVFNPGPDLTLSVNNGPQFDVPGASPPSWLPGSTPILFDPAGPEVNVLGPGVNFLTVTAEGAIEPVELSLNLPSGVEYTTLQLYLFQGPRYGLVVLNEGELVASILAPG